MGSIRIFFKEEYFAKYYLQYVFFFLELQCLADDLDEVNMGLRMEKKH